MREPLTFFAAGIPKAQPRAKAVARGGFARVYNPGTADDWKMIVRNEASKAWNRLPWVGPLRVDLTFHFPRPKAHYTSRGELKPTAPTWHITKPDRDNLDKGVLDALTQLGMWADDKGVCAGEIKKVYANGGNVGCEITIQECEP